MNSTSFAKQNSQAVKALTGHSGSYLMELALKHVAPTWDGVLEALGENVLETRKHINLTPKQFKIAIRALAEAKRPIHAGALQDDHSPESRAVLKKKLGSAISGAQVYWAGYSKNGRDWAKALREAKLNPELFVRKRNWTRDDLLEAVTALHKHKIPLNVLSLYSPSYGEFLWAYCGLAANGQSFYRAGVKHFGSWDNLLIAANLDPYQIRRSFWRRGHLSTTPSQEEGGVHWIGTTAKESSEIAMGREFLDKLSAVIANLRGKEATMAASVADEVLGSNSKLDAATIAKNLGYNRKDVEGVLKQFRESSLFSPDDAP